MKKKTAARQARLDKMVAKRTAYWDEKRPKWKSEPIAFFEDPLKYIKRETREIEIDQETGLESTKLSNIYWMAVDFARYGDGEAVNWIARTVLAERSR